MSNMKSFIGFAILSPENPDSGFILKRIDGGIELYGIFAKRSQAEQLCRKIGVDPDFIIEVIVRKNIS